MAELVVPLRAGSFRATLAGTTLRDITFRRSEILRAVAPTIRTGTWGTVEPRLVGHRAEEIGGGFSVSLELEARAPELALDYIVTYEASEAGVLTCRIDGISRETSRVNRWGFCLLFGMAMAGRTIQVRVRDSIESHELPTVISPERPISGFDSIAYVTVEGVAAQVDLGGTRFQLEDQRNWGDATFKAFSPPLADPHPLVIGIDEHFTQTITIHADAPSGQLRSRGEMTKTRPDDVRHSLPSIGTSIRPEDLPWERDTVAALREVGLDLLQVDIDTRRGQWRDDLAVAVVAAEQVAVPLTVHIIAADLDEDDLRVVKGQGNVIEAVGVFDPISHTTTARLLPWLDRLAGASGILRLIGSRAHAVQVFRGWPPVRGDILTLAFTPGAHYSDRWTLVENLEGIDHIIRQVSETQPMPVVVGPITLGARFNDAAAVAAPNPPDERQAQAFGAAWALGMIAVAARRGIERLTLFEATGPGGLVAGEASPMLSPAAQLIRELSSRRTTIGTVKVWTRSGILRAQVGDGATELMANLSDVAVAADGERIEPDALFVRD